MKRAIRRLEYTHYAITLNEILRERRSVTPAMALRLSRLFGNSPEFWLNAQHSWDLWDSEQRFHEVLARAHPETQSGHA